MSNFLPDQLKNLTDDELIDFALQHLGEDELRRSALQEHLLRSADNPEMVEAPAGDVEQLQAKLSKLSPSTST